MEWFYNFNKIGSVPKGWLTTQKVYTNSRLTCTNPDITVISWIDLFRSIFIFILHKVVLLEYVLNIHGDIVFRMVNMRKKIFF